MTTTFADGSQRVYVNSNSEEAGFEEVITFDKDGNFVSKEKFTGKLSEPIQEETSTTSNTESSASAAI